MVEIPVLDSTLLPTGPYTTGVNSSGTNWQDYLTRVKPRERTHQHTVQVWEVHMGRQLPPSTGYCESQTRLDRHYCRLRAKDIHGALQKDVKSMTRSLSRRQMYNIGRAS